MCEMCKASWCNLLLSLRKPDSRVKPSGDDDQLRGKLCSHMKDHTVPGSQVVRISVPYSIEWNIYVIPSSRPFPNMAKV